MGFYKNKNVLITGAAGITGHAAIRRLLDEGAYVRAVEFKNRKVKLQHDNLEIVRHDLMQHNECMSALKDIDICLNFVAYIRGAKGQIDPKNYLDLVRRNLIPSINMFDAAVRTGIDRFGFIGSSTMYPNVSHAVKDEEAFSGDPHHLYVGVGEMKRYCEKVIKYFNNISDTNFAIVRTSAIYGPHYAFNENGHAIPQLVLKADAGMNPFEVWGDGTQVLDFVYVDDVVDGLLCVLEKNPNAVPYNVATGEGTTITELVKTITNIYDYEPEFNYDTTKPIMINKRLLDVSKINNDLGWSASHNLKSGLQKTIDWYRDNK